MPSTLEILRRRNRAKKADQNGESHGGSNRGLLGEDKEKRTSEFCLCKSRPFTRAPICCLKLEDSAPPPDTKAKAVEEMMDRIKKGIVLKPTKRIQVR